MSDSSLKLGKYSLGVGDRFAQQAAAQLQACVLAAGLGVEVIPVWNKSNREHLIIGSDPATVRAAAAAAVQELGWRKPWHVDADHIRLETVDRFLTSMAVRLDLLGDAPPGPGHVSRDDASGGATDPITGGAAPRRTTSGGGR